MEVGTGGATTRFFGREGQLDAVRRALGGPGVLVTLLGPGGAGKTSTAREYFRQHPTRATHHWQRRAGTGETPLAG